MTYAAVLYQPSPEIAYCHIATRLRHKLKIAASSDLLTQHIKVRINLQWLRFDLMGRYQMDLE